MILTILGRWPLCFGIPAWFCRSKAVCYAQGVKTNNVIDEDSVRKGRPASGCGRNYTILMEVGLPKLFHRFTRLAMITPSRCCDSGLRVSRLEPIHRLIREICASTRERNP